MPKAFQTFLRWLPAILWMSFIFAGSSDTLSGEHTSRFLGPFLKWLLGSSFTPERAESVHYLIRKAGHLSEYGILCTLLWFALGSLDCFTLGTKAAKRAWLSILLSGIYAATDEFHQSFVPSRTANISDVLIDAAGAMLGMALLLGIWRTFRSRHQAGLACAPAPDPG